MTYRTIVVSSYEKYLEFAETEPTSNAERVTEDNERRSRISRFPYFLMLELAFAELDFANRWCWENFGPADGDCDQSYSEYPACAVKSPHHHTGRWMTHWYVKTEYNFGFNEWYFMEESSFNRFRDAVPLFNWGDLYPKRTS